MLDVQHILSRREMNISSVGLMIMDGRSPIAVTTTPMYLTRIDSDTILISELCLSQLHKTNL